MALDRIKTPTPPPQNIKDNFTTEKHFHDLDFFFREGCAIQTDTTITDVSGSGEMPTALNAILAALREAKVIKT